jgi:hypothetical protein
VCFMNSVVLLGAQTPKAVVRLQLLVKLSELLKRSLVMCTGTLSEDLHAEVSIRNLLFIIFFTLGTVVLHVQTGL